MEMVYGGIGGMAVGWIVGRVLKLSEIDTITALTMGGGGSLLTGLAYLWIADISLGSSGSLLWFPIGALGGIVGVTVFLFARYLDVLVDLAKRNGLL